MFKGNYQSLKIWQKSMELCRKIYKITLLFPKEEIYGLTYQIRRSSVSIPSNIAEGSRRVSDKEFSNFILIARVSLAEIETQIILAHNFFYLDKGILEKLLKEIIELDKMIFSFHKSLLRLPATSS